MHIFVFMCVYVYLSICVRVLIYSVCCRCCPGWHGYSGQTAVVARSLILLQDTDTNSLPSTTLSEDLTFLPLTCVQYPYSVGNECSHPVGSHSIPALDALEVFQKYDRYSGGPPAHLALDAKIGIRQAGQVMQGRRSLCTVSPILLLINLPHPQQRYVAPFPPWDGSFCLRELPTLMCTAEHSVTAQIWLMENRMLN